MSYQSDNLDLEILEVGDPADLTTVSDNFEKIDAVAGDMATVETSPTQAAHSIGEFLLYGGHLYKVTSAISAGGSLILGTNVQAANIGSEIKSLQDSVSTSLNVVPPYSSTAIAKVDEYIRYSKYGKLVIVDIGGVYATKTGVVNNAIYNLPIFRTRPVASMFLDRGTERLGIYYGNLGSTALTQNFYIANTTNKPAYGQIVYLTD